MRKKNDDLGPNWLLHWDIVLYGQVKTASGFFNRDAIDYSSSSATHVEKYKTFFDYYFNPCQIKFPNYTKNDVSSENDEKSNLNRYSTEDADKPVFLTEYFEKVIPKDLGICDYPYSVWVKLTIASDNTVVKGEFLPSIPAVYGGINQKDDRVLNNSMAHDIIPYQDQLSNIVSQMLLNMKAGLMKLYIFNKDVIDSETQEALKNILKNENYYANPQALFVSRTELADVGIDVKSAVEVIESSISHNISDSIRAMSELMGLAERLLVFSPQELGQPAPREISAREVQEISNTTNSIFTSISDDVDYQREGLKKLLYESLLCCSSDKVEVPTLERYPESVVEAAGFKIVEDKTTGEKDVIRRTILGSVQDLRHDVLFTSRDGAERFSNTQAAQTLTQLIAQVVQLPPVMEKMGDAKLFEMVNEVFRLTGSDLNLESDEDITPDLNQQLQEAIAALTQRLATVEAAAGIPSPEGQGGAPAGGAPPAAPPAGSPA
ncbi:MAG: hypothetical protein JRJ68_03285 [Deltaproteobacteria bacterium]|nr:hypothetical protein [Deltaproteobacteria bacterium]